MLDRGIGGKSQNMKKSKSQKFWDEGTEALWHKGVVLDGVDAVERGCLAV
jgi:hypothetical protein